MLVFNKEDIKLLFIVLTILTLILLWRPTDICVFGGFPENMSEPSRKEVPMTDSIQWSSDYEVGNTDIDAQHQWLFEIAQKIREPGLGIDKEKEILKELYNYTSIHFKKEEELMQSVGYPDLLEHLEYHQLLIKNLDDLTMIDEYKRGGLEHLVELLMKWIREHILNQDMAFFNYMREHQTLPER